MSLRDLKDEIYLILQIKEGYSFGFATSPLVITANLAGNIHESFIVEPSHQPKFENVFVWIMDKTKMKNIWAEKLPVRIECFSVNQSQRSRIGYIILNVKDAQIAQDEAKITEKQMRLLGLSRDASLLKPELVFSFYLTDVPIQSSLLKPQFSPRMDGSRLKVTSEPVKVVLPPGRDNITLTIDVVKTHNLEKLLPSQSEGDLPEIKYCYNLLDRDFVSDGRLQVSLQSCMSSVNNYLCNSTVSVTVDNTTLGHAVMNMKSLVWNDGAGRKPKSASRSANCRCVVTPTVPAAGVEAWIEFAISLVVDTAVVKKKSSANALRAVGAGGDADNPKLPLPLKPPTARLATKSLPSLHDSVAVAGGGGGETYRTQQPTTSHTVVVNVTSIQLDLQPDTQLWLRLTQPSAVVSPFDPVPLPQQWSPMQYQMSLRVPSHLVHTILTSQPPSLQLGADDTVLASATIYPTTDGCNTTAELKSSEGMRVGEVSVVWGNNQSPSADICSQSAPILTDTSLSSPTCSRPKSVDPEVLSPRHREMKILSFVEELEDWTDKQRLIVMEGLKEEEAARLAALQAQWETEVGGQVSEGRQLLQTLHNMRDELKHQQDQLRDNQYKLKVYKEELERVHRSKLQEFKDISRRMQDEFNHKLALIASDKAALEQDVEQLREENTEMKHKWREMEQTMMKDKRTIDTLSHELNVLKEQLNMEVESKRFFKEHCRKAEQEIHRLNCLRQEELEEKLLSNKKSLEHLAFQHIIVEKNDLRQDQELLNEIRQQLLRAPAANYDSNGGTVCSERTKDDRHIRRAT